MADNTNNTKNATQRSDENHSFDDIESLQNEIIEMVYPELLFLDKRPSAGKLDYENLLQSLSDTSDIKFNAPNPDIELMNPSVNDIEFVGYNISDACISKKDTQKTESDIAYEKWLGQHKAIIMSSRKENRKSKAPSLKSTKEAEPTKMIRLNISDFADNGDENTKKEETPKPMNKVRISPENMVPTAVPINASESEPDPSTITGNVKSIFEYKKDQHQTYAESQTVDTEQFEKKKIRPKTQILPNSPAPIPDSGGHKKKSFDEKIEDSKKSSRKKSKKTKKKETENFFGMPPMPEDK